MSTNQISHDYYDSIHSVRLKGYEKECSAPNFYKFTAQIF